VIIVKERSSIEDVYGDEVHLRSGVRAGKIESDKFIETYYLRTLRGAKASRIEISRRGIAHGPLIGKVIIVKERSSIEDVYGDEVHLRSGVRAGKIVGRRIILEHGCEVDEVIYSEQLRSDSGVRVRVPPKKTEELPKPPF
jgi:hypothetical protein